MKSLRKRALLVCVALGGALALGWDGLSEEPGRGQSDPAAERLLGEVVRAYKALNTYADRGELELATIVDGKTQAQKTPLHLDFERPNRLSLDTGLARVVCDGKTLTTVVTPLKKYTEEPAPAVIGFDTVFAGGPVGSAVFGGPSSPMMLVLLNLLMGDDPARAMRDLGDRWELGEDRKLDGKACRVLRLTSEATRPAYSFLIDPESHLLRAIEVTSDPAALADAFPKGQDVKLATYRWTAGAVSTGEPREAAFAFEAPKDFSKVGNLAGAKGEKAEPRFKVETLLDRPAPDFAMTLLDGAGKTRTVSKADLAGKVVLIDFWATWCGPCLAELPEVRKLIDSLNKDKDKDVLVVALSQDNDPREPAEVRKLIEKTLAEEKVELAGDGNRVGKIGLDPSNAVGEAFQVEGFPTVVLLDQKGVVRAVHVGYVEDYAKVLGGQIEALLAGKPIEKEEKDGK